jgi:hypothetical protein
VNRYLSRTRRTRRLTLVAVLAPLGGLIAYEALTKPRASGTGAGGATGSSRGPLVGSDTPGAVAAYLSATGIFAQPAVDGRPEEFAAAEAAAASAGAPLAFSVWTDIASFDARAWRDVLQVGRVPLFRPPSVDFEREVAILIWPSPSASPAIRRAPGLTLRGAVLRHTAVEIQVVPATDGTPRATPIGSASVLPYALVTVPRNQWPIPAPPPTVPPLTVALAP